MSDLTCLVHSGEIKEGLERCHSELDEALSRFHVSPFPLEKCIFIPTNWPQIKLVLWSPFSTMKPHKKGHFHSSNLINHATQRDILMEMRRDSAEKKELLLAILSMQSERQQVVALQRQGEHVAEELMAAGQQVS